MKTIYNTARTKKVRLIQQEDSIFALYVQIYKNSEQVLNSKSFKTLQGATKWAIRQLEN